MAVIDYDMDGWPDLAVSNDTQPNKLYHNNHDGTFTEQAVQAGIAFSEDGVARGAMGIDADDFDHSGYPSLAIGNFSNQMIGLYHNEGNRFFIDDGAVLRSGPRQPALALFRPVLFSITISMASDDLFVANGHIEPDIAHIQHQVAYAELPLVFHDEGHGQVSGSRQELGFTRRMVARGAAYADIDNDGAPDVLITHQRRARLSVPQRRAEASNNAIRIRTVGTRSNRDGIGAVVRVHASSGDTAGRLFTPARATAHRAN